MDDRNHRDAGKSKRGSMMTNQSNCGRGNGHPIFIATLPHTSLLFLWLQGRCHSIFALYLLLSLQKLQ